jgi:hypothetical protein
MLAAIKRRLSREGHPDRKETKATTKYMKFADHEESDELVTVQIVLRTSLAVLWTKREQNKTVNICSFKFRELLESCCWWRYSNLVDNTTFKIQRTDENDEAVNLATLLKRTGGHPKQV